jgi:hypothetical protein
MKNHFLVSFILVALMFSNSSIFSQTKPGSWAELKKYHTAMSSTFHPVEDGNFEPIKTRSADLVEAAKEWKNSTPPADFNKPNIKEKLNLLYDESVTLDKFIKVKTHTDEEIKVELTKLHDRFHEIVGACKAENKEEGH